METSGLWLRDCCQDAGFPCVFQFLRPISLHTYSCQRFPPALNQAQQAELKGAVQQPPSPSGIAMANWYWRVVRQLVSERFGINLCRSSCLNYLHRLGFAFKRPKKRLLKANESKRKAFVAEYAALGEEAQLTGAKVFFATRPISGPTPSYGASGC